VAGTITAGPTLNMDLVADDTLSALVVVDVETNTITMEAVWQVSNDATTWYECRGLNNAAIVVLGTGTGGADASVSRVLEAPKAVYGWRYARCSIRNLVATGAAVDTYAISYNFRKPSL
jgi:hypothetical protein